MTRKDAFYSIPIVATKGVPAAARVRRAAALAYRRLGDVLTAPLGAAGLLAAVIGVSALAPAPAGANGVDPNPVAYAPSHRDVLEVHLGRAMQLELPRPAREVLVSDPRIVDVVLRTAQQPVLFGARIGQANILFFDEHNRQIRQLEIRVEFDASSLNELIRRHFPNADVKAESSLGEIMLSGFVRSSVEAAAIESLAERFVASVRASRSDSDNAPKVDREASGVVNRIVVLNEEQVHLQVRVAEVSRSILKELGLDWNAALASTTVASTINIKAGNIFSFLSATGSRFQFGPEFLSSLINVLEQAALVRTLAEPSLTAVSGESASFLAGGEFPIPVPAGDEGTITIEFKRFGVGLDFTPVVLGDGRISLRIATEVSALTETGSVLLDGFDIPALTVRRADTTVEVGSGGTIMIAGLIQDETRRLSAGLPGLRSLPIIGGAFRTEETEINETELVVMVTPYMVRPGDPDDFQAPTDGFPPASDLDVYLFGRLHARFGAEPKNPEIIREGLNENGVPVGFMME